MMMAATTSTAAATTTTTATMCSQQGKLETTHFAVDAQPRKNSTDECVGGTHS